MSELIKSNEINESVRERVTKSSEWQRRQHMEVDESSGAHESCLEHSRIENGVQKLKIVYKGG